MESQVELNEMSHKLQNAVARNEQLLLQVHQLEEELELFFLKDTKRDLEEAKAKAEHLAIAQSKSWKITAPLRSVFAMLGIN